MIVLLNHRTSLLLLCAGATLMVGCASQTAARGPVKPGAGLVEYRQIVAEAHKAMGTALRALDRVSTQTDRCPSRVLAAFSKEADQLEVDSIRMRARAQAIQTRGAAYFENWHENLARVEDPRVRELATQHRAELQRRFANIQRSSENTRQSFKPFLAGLREIQGALETEPAAVASEATKNLIRTARGHGQQVDQAITAIGEELNAMASLLTPSKTGRQP